MSKRLENFIKENKEEFDTLEPQRGLWANIEERLPVQFDEKKKVEKKTFTLSFVLRVAASVIVIMGISFAFYLRNEHRTNNLDLAGIDPVYAKQQAQYTKLISNKLEQLKTITRSEPQLYQQFTAEIARIDSTYKKLNEGLPTSPNRELVLRAMIRNLQVQAEAINQQLIIIEQYNRSKKEQNENKDI